MRTGIIRVAMMSVAACLFFGAAQCDTNLGPGPGPEPTTRKTSKQKFVDGISGYFERCLMPTDSFMYELETTYFDRLYGQIGVGQAYGEIWDQMAASSHVEIDEAALDRCIAWMDTVACNTHESWSADCAAAFVGSLQSGELCAGSEECAGDADCRNLSDTSCGYCVMQAGLGESCAETSCARALSCTYSDQICANPAGLGQSCQNVGCGDGLECGDGDFCHTPVTVEYAVGDTCSTTDQKCGNWSSTGMVCKDDDGDGNGICVKSSIAEEGQPCEFASSGSMLIACRNGFVTTHYCDADVQNGERQGICRARPSTGEACVELFNYCNGLESECIEGMCVAVLPVGANCQEDSEPSCGLFASCDDETLKCAAQGSFQTPPRPVCE